MNMLRLKQRGFSLIELMVAMTIGTFIIAGLLSVFISATNSYRVQQALIEVQDKGRFALEKLREGIQIAGLGLDDNETAVRVVAAGGASDCNNAFEPVLEIYFNETDVAPNSLMCFRLASATGGLQRNQTVEGTAVGASEITIIDSVDQINFTFAVDTDGDGVDTLAGNIYQSAATLEAAAAPQWSDVIAVRIELVVASNTDNVIDATNLQSFADVGFAAAAGDTRLHQVYTAVIALRNRML